MDWSDFSDTDGVPGLPNEVVVVKAISYSVEDALSCLQINGDYPHPDLADVLNIIKSWAAEDFGCKWNHPVDPESLTFMDDEGNVISLQEDEE